MPIYDIVDILSNKRDAIFAYSILPHVAWPAARSAALWAFLSQRETYLNSK